MFSVASHRQKTSKVVNKCQQVPKHISTLFDNFRAGQTTSKIAKKCQKGFRHFWTTFARHQFFGPFWGGSEVPGQKRHININFLLWLTSQMALGQTAGCPWVNRGQKVYVFASKHRKYKLFPLVNRRVVPGCPTFKCLCVQSLCAFFLP